MLSLKLDQNGDLEFDELNNFRMIEGKEELAQRLALGIKTRAGEWFLDTSLGIPWFKLLGDKDNEEMIKSEVRRVLMEDSAIKTVDDLTLIRTGDRSITIDFKCTLSDDPTGIYQQTVEV